MGGSDLCLPLSSKGKFQNFGGRSPLTRQTHYSWGFFPGVFLNCKTNDGKTYAPSIPGYDWPSNFVLYGNRLPIDFAIWSLHFVASFYCRLAQLGKNFFLHKQLLTPALPIPSLICKLNGNSVATTFYPTLVKFFGGSILLNSIDLLKM